MRINIRFAGLFHVPADHARLVPFFSHRRHRCSPANGRQGQHRPSHQPSRQGQRWIESSPGIVENGHSDLCDVAVVQRQSLDELEAFARILGSLFQQRMDSCAITGDRLSI